MSQTPLDLIRRLVGFDTVSVHSNLALIHYVRDYLRDFGIDSRLTFDADGKKANLLAVIRPNIPGGIVLSGHTNVVPVAGQPWESDPFTVVERDNRLYGRGTSDMKSFLAIALALVPEFQAARLRVPIYLALSFDEEVGCLCPAPGRDLCAPRRRWTARACQAHPARSDPGAHPRRPRSRRGSRTPAARARRGGSWRGRRSRRRSTCPPDAADRTGCARAGGAAEAG